MDNDWLRSAEERIKQDPDSWAHLQHVRNPGLPPIDRLPQPGDVIRSNESPCELMVKRVLYSAYGSSYECRVINDGQVTQHKTYRNNFYLRDGRLLSRQICPPTTSGFNIYSRGQVELFILRRAQGQLDLFAL